jgi:hypothetical protein
MTIPVVTISNFGYLPYVENLRESIRRAGITWQLIILCMDAKTVEYCKKRSIPCFPCSTNAGNEALNWKDHEHVSVQRILIQKLDCLLQFMSAYPQMSEYIYMDGDIMVFKDFVPYVSEFSKAYDMVFQCDEFNYVPTCHSYLPGTVCANACTGFMYIKNTPFNRTVLDYRRFIGDTVVLNADQGYINGMIKRSHRLPETSFRTKIVKWTTFPRDLITNGSYLGNLPPCPYILHYNFLVGTDKKKKMQENGHWFE